MNWRPRRRGYLQQSEVERANDSGLSGDLANSLLAGRTLVFDAKQEAAIAALTVEQVNAALRKHLKLERLFVALAGDFK